MREINVSRAGDPVHAGDKALTRETLAQRGRVNRYVNSQNGSTGHTGGGHFIHTVCHVHILNHDHFTDIASTLVI